MAVNHMAAVATKWGVFENDDGSEPAIHWKIERRGNSRVLLLRHLHTGWIAPPHSQLAQELAFYTWHENHRWWGTLMGKVISAHRNTVNLYCRDALREIRSERMPDRLVDLAVSHPVMRHSDALDTITEAIARGDL